MASRTKYTRRTTRDRLIDLLEEAIKLVKVRCVGPEEDVLEQARKEFQEAADMKNQAAELLKTVREATPYPQNQYTTNALITEPVTLAPQPPRNTTVKVKKLPSCPGGPKAFNEFLKSKRAEVEANLGPNAKYADVRAEIAKRWKQACRANTNTKKVSKKKTTMTPGRVNAPIPFNSTGVTVAPLTQAPEPIELAEVPEVPVEEAFQGSNYQAPEAPEAPEASNYQENIEETPAPL
jgi:predicted Zn-dependent protease